MLITAIILTYNESLHIKRCIQSIQPYVREVFVIDSFSTDNTVELAKGLGAKVYQNPFVNQAVQFNWALANCPIKGEWIIRIDADEYIDNRKNIDLQDYLNNIPKEINGLHISRKIKFLGGELKHGTWYPKWNLRIFRAGKGTCENRWMDEHIVLTEGISQKLWFDFVDDNLNNLNWWISKHNNYSDREVADYFFQLEADKQSAVKPKAFGSDAERKRWLKKQYHKFPLFFRPFLNFTYRYFFRLGFLDGKQGFLWHILQGFWYRMLVDAKIWELKRRFKNKDQEIIDYLKITFNL
jgi:glycosyltransferase involved in cell wall biosynthesis